MRLPGFHIQITTSLVLAVAAGLITGADSTLFGISFVSIYDFLGTLFLNALKMLIVPLILSSIVTGIAGMNRESGIGRLGGLTVLYYALTSLAAILAGLVLVQVIAPGIHNGTPVGESIGLSALQDDVVAKIGGRGAGDIAAVFIRMIPPNIVHAAAQGQMLGLIFFGILMGCAISKLCSDGMDAALTFRRWWDGLFQVMMLVTQWVMKLAPVGIFGLVAEVTATTGFEGFASLGRFFCTVLLALLFHAAVTLPIVLRACGISPLQHTRAMLPALVTAFSTASSSATLPVTIECLEKDAGIPNRITSFVLPLGATVNMDGTALYECVAAMFLAQAYGLHLSFAQQFTVVITALLTSIGVAGIPAASLVAIAVILNTIGLPTEAIAPILIVDRLLDMCRTAVNVFSDSCGAAVIARVMGREQA